MALAVDTALAARLERMTARVLESFHDASRSLDASNSEMITVAGAVATYLMPGSPLNHAAGIGFAGPVTAEDVERLEHFFDARGERAVASLCPLADPSAIEAFAQRSWTVSGFENVLVRPLHPGDRFADSPRATDAAGATGATDATSPANAVEVTEAVAEDERDLWAQIAAAAFSAPLEPLAEQLWVAAVAAHRPESRLFIGHVDGAAAGTGELAIEDGVAWLSADATLPAFRRRGVQHAIQRARLQAAIDAGCTLAVSESHPGSASQRNMERLGFAVAYTRVELMAPMAQTDPNKEG